KMKQVSRYHPLLVTLHWVLAVLIIAELTLGFFGLAATSNSDPRKIDIPRVHMTGGVLILALMVLRFIVRMRTSRLAAGRCHHRLSASRSDRADLPLRLLRAGPDDGRDRVCDRDYRGARRDCVWFLRRSVTAHPDDLSGLCGPHLFCDAPERPRRFARAC